MKVQELIEILNKLNPNANIHFLARETDSDETINRNLTPGELVEVQEGFDADPAGYPTQFHTPEEVRTWQKRWAMEGSWSKAYTIVTRRSVYD